MEARKITIVSTKTQKKSVIMSGAETLAELKRDLNEAGIDYTDMAFYEGTSKTELKTDESVLPKDVPYTNRTTGETKNTNELVFMLTNTNKKIRSGALSRAEAYDAVKKYALQEACINKYGKNFTRCSTNDLILLIEDYTSKEEKAYVAGVPVAPSAPVTECVDIKARTAITELVHILNETDTITDYEKEVVLRCLNTDMAPTVSDEYKPDFKSSYSDNEIDAMFSDMD